MKNWPEEFLMYLGIVSAIPLIVAGVGIAIFLFKALFYFSGIPE